MEVLPCSEFKRIQKIPVYQRSPKHWQDLAIALTEHVKTPNGSMVLRPVQGQMCSEAYDNRSLFAMSPVGSGKTIPSLLIPALLQSQRPLLMVKAGLRAQTFQAMQDYGKHFRIHDSIKVLSYEMLSQPHAQEILTEIRPDCIVCDEVQLLKNFGAARTRRFLRFMQVQDKVPPFVALSGTMTKRSLRDFWMFMCLVFPEDGSPLPYKQGVMEEWALAVDAKVDPLQRIAPGCLLEFAKQFGVGERPDNIEKAREGLYRRMVSTCGVVAMKESSCRQPLTLQVRPLQTPQPITEAIQRVQDTALAPNGDECDSQLEIWRYCRELACGFFGVWSPPAPEDWLEARKAWHRFVRDILAVEDPRLDSPFLIAKHYEDHPLHVAWSEIRPTFEPNTVPVWVDDFLVDDAANWLADHQGIVWTEHVTVGERIAEKAGVRYYGGGPRSARDILHVKGPCVASIQAHGAGRNLQHYNRALITSFPTCGATVEQLLGRLHRQGQNRPVTFDIYLHSGVLWAGLMQAIEDAQYTKQITGIDQKLLLARKEFDV